MLFLVRISLRFLDHPAFVSLFPYVLLLVQVFVVARIRIPNFSSVVFSSPKFFLNSHKIFVLLYGVGCLSFVFGVRFFVKSLIAIPLCRAILVFKF